MFGFSDYQESLSLNYPQNKFLTPSEIFRPFYGWSVARKILSLHKKFPKEKLVIYELGSGLGGQAESFLSYLKYYEPKVYK